MRILVADDDSNVQYALRSLFDGRPEVESVIEVVDTEGLLAQIKAACPDLVLLDWELSGMEGDRMLSALRELCPDLWIVALSGRPEAHTAALDAGADTIVSKMDHPGGLLTVVDVCRRRRQVETGDAGTVEE